MKNLLKNLTKMLGLACFLLLSLAASAQIGDCVKCQGKPQPQCVGMIPTGGCQCDPGPPCMTCGLCVYKCMYNCGGPPPMSQKQWVADHPHFTSKELPAMIAAYSVPLGKLIEAEQYVATKGRCMGSAYHSGMFSLIDVRSWTAPLISWESVEQKGVIKFRIYNLPDEAKGQPNLLFIDEVHRVWSVEDEVTGKEIARGTFQ